MRSTNQQTASLKRLSAPPTPTLNDNALPELRQIILNGREGEAIHRLFGIAETISKQAAEDLFGNSLFENLIEARLLGEEKHKIFSYFHIQTYKGLVFLSDYSLPQGIPHDFVLPVGSSGRYLEAITIRKEVDSALDLGCGCGFQTLFLAIHSRLVTATDINPRCLTLTALNARLNDIHNIELLEGSYFEPVHGRKFDLIVSNTPYVITPDKTQIYRDAKGSGDQAVLNVIWQIPDFLNDGGYAHVLATWLHKKRQVPEEPIHATVKHLPVDTLLVYEQSFSPIQYANDWVYDDIPRGTPLFYWTWFQWVLWYRRMGMERFAFGSVTMRMRSGKVNRFRTETAWQIAGESAGGHIHQLFLAGDHELHLLDLWETKLIPSHLEVKKDEKGEVRRIQMKESLVLPIKVSPFVGQVIGHFDGRRTLRQAWEKAMEEEIAIPEKEADALPILLTLVNNGYLTIA
jgi:SAM-dependent methyltransferase